MIVSVRDFSSNVASPCTKKYRADAPDEYASHPAKKPRVARRGDAPEDPWKNEPAGPVCSPNIWDCMVAEDPWQLEAGLFVMQDF